MSLKVATLQAEIKQLKDSNEATTIALDIELQAKESYRKLVRALESEVSRYRKVLGRFYVRTAN